MRGHSARRRSDGWSHPETSASSSCHAVWFWGCSERGVTCESGAGGLGSPGPVSSQRPYKERGSKVRGEDRVRATLGHQQGPRSQAEEAGSRSGLEPPEGRGRLHAALGAHPASGLAGLKCVVSAAESVETC